MALGRRKSTKVFWSRCAGNQYFRGSRFSNLLRLGLGSLILVLVRPAGVELAQPLCVFVFASGVGLQQCADVMALRKSPVPVSDVSSNLDGLFLFQHCPHSTTPRLNKPHRIAVSCLVACHGLLSGCQSPLAWLPFCVTASGSAYPDVTNQHNNQVQGSHASWHATIRFASPCLSPHAAPLSPFSSTTVNNPLGPFQISNACF